jgi:hypothetical protein
VAAIPDRAKRGCNARAAASATLAAELAAARNH